jgi:hypothetical protein
MTYPYIGRTRCIRARLLPTVSGIAAMNFIRTSATSVWSGDCLEPLDGLFFSLLQQEVQRTTRDASPFASLDSLDGETDHPEAMLPLVWGIRYGLEHNLPQR